MMKAHVRDGVAVNVCSKADLAESFHPDVAALFEDVPRNVKVGWIRDQNGTWGPPPTPSDSDDPASPLPPE